MDVIVLKDSAFSPWAELESFQNQYMQNHTDFGATATFVGTMRDFNEGDDVLAMELEHYPQMTDAKLQSLQDDMHKQWGILHSLIIHRIGKVEPADPIVLVAVWSAHRAAAFDACRFLMETLKSTVPFWKKEYLVDGSERWVEKNTLG
ncbi:MAG: molybdenum cofactor biosynthesis protein MoaE [Thiotrichaceae bacterium]|nr:molybdenum cofactor biosynthesis protein MoaE [Thiotrichaceae bacterium]